MVKDVVGPHPFTKFYAVHSVHHQVGKDDVGHGFLSLGQRLLAIGCEHGVVFPACHHSNVSRNVGVVLHDEEHGGLRLIAFRVAVLRGGGVLSVESGVPELRPLNGSVPGIGLDIGIVQGHGDHKSGTLSGVFGRYGSPHFLNHVLYEVEPDARCLSQRLVFARIEEVEDVGQVVLGNALAGIFHGEEELSGVAFQFHGDGPSLWHVLDAVGNKVPDDFGDILPHESRLNIFVFRPVEDGDVSRGGKLVIGFKHHADVCHHVAPCPLLFVLSGEHFRGLEQLVDQCEQAIALFFYVGEALHLLVVVHFRMVDELPAEAVDDGQRRAELMCDIGEKEVSHLCQTPEDIP